MIRFVAYTEKNVPVTMAETASQVLKNLDKIREDYHKYIVDPRLRKQVYTIKRVRFEPNHENPSDIIKTITLNG